MGVSRVASKAQTWLQKIPNDIIARSVGQSIFLATEGVFTALSNLDWYQLVVPEAGVYTGPGVSSAIAANRISRSAEKREPLSFFNTTPMFREGHFVCRNPRHFLFWMVNLQLDG